MLNLTLATLTILSIFLVVYHHVVYPLVLGLISRRSRTSESFDAADIDPEQLPSITMVMPAHNEAEYIAKKIHNLAILQYPANKLKIIIACDGCTDNTVELARQTCSMPECQHLNVDIRDYAVNSGKVAVLNKVIEDIDSDLVALSDISALLSIDALLITAKDFEQQHIGLITGKYQLWRAGSQGEQGYWNYQSAIKQSESNLGSTLGAHGAFYVFRRKLFVPLEPDTINDDFILPMNIVAQGYKAFYEPRINALELESASQQQDSKRRKRIAAGNAQQLIRLKHLLAPRFKGVAFAFFSGKALRVFMPFLMLIAFAGSAAMAVASGHWLWWGIFLSQLSIYLLAISYHFIKPQQKIPLLQPLYYLVAGHTASFAGVMSYFLGKEKGQWKRVT